MVAYGCCENNDKSYDNIHKTFPDLRVCAVPYASDLQTAADNLKNQVMAWRPLAEPLSIFDEVKYREETMKQMEIMKDNNSAFWCQAPLTLEGHPEIYEKMVRIVKEWSEMFAR